MNKAPIFLSVFCLSLFCLLCMSGVSKAAKDSTKKIDFIYLSSNDELRAFVSGKTYDETEGVLRYHFKDDGTYFEQYLKKSSLYPQGELITGKWYPDAGGDKLCLEQYIESENVSAPAYCFGVRLLPEVFAKVSYHIHPFLLTYKDDPDNNYLALRNTMLGSFIFNKEGVNNYKTGLRAVKSLEKKMQTLTQGQNTIQPQSSFMEQLYNFVMNKVIETELLYIVPYPNGSVVVAPKSIYNSGADIKKIRMATATGFWHLEGNAFCFKASSVAFKKENIQCLTVQKTSDLLEPQEGFLVHNSQGYSFVLNDQNAYSVNSTSYPEVFAQP